VTQIASLASLTCSGTADSRDTSEQLDPTEDTHVCVHSQREGEFVCVCVCEREAVRACLKQRDETPAEWAELLSLCLSVRLSLCLFLSLTHTNTTRAQQVF